MHASLLGLLTLGLSISVGLCFLLDEGGARALSSALTQVVDGTTVNVTVAAPVLRAALPAGGCFEDRPCVLNASLAAAPLAGGNLSYSANASLTLALAAPRGTLRRVASGGVARSATTDPFGGALNLSARALGLPAGIELEVRSRGRIGRAPYPLRASHHNCCPLRCRLSGLSLRRARTARTAARTAGCARRRRAVRTATTRSR